MDKKGHTVRGVIMADWNGAIYSGYFREVNGGHLLGSSAGNHPKGRTFTRENNFAIEGKKEEIQP